MHRRLRTVVRVLAAGVTLGILLSEMIGCANNGGGCDCDVDIPMSMPRTPAYLLDIDPPDGGEIRVDGRLVLRYNQDPIFVAVSSSPATLVDTTATWTATGLTAGEQATLAIEWEGDSETITLTVIESTCAPSGEGCVDLVSTDPLDGGELALDQWLIVTFSGDPGPVTVNGHLATRSDSSVAEWYPEGLAPGGQAVLDIVWDDGSAAITVTVLEPSCARLLDACETDEDCCVDLLDLRCVLGTCSALCVRRDDACEDDGDCCEELACVNGTCTEGEQCVQTSFPCQSDAECCPLNDGVPVFCVAGSCGGTCQQPRQPCGEAQLCCDEVPCVNGVCACAGFGEACETDDDCCGDSLCVDGTCN